MEKVIVLTGPTAVGKSKIALEIAKQFNFDIINGDAYQIYRTMDIGTAKPTSDERLVVPHRLFDILEPTDSFSICDYQKIVRKEIADQTKKGKIPFIVGGSGLYINSVIYDYQFSDQPRSNEFSLLTTDAIYEKLKALDPNTTVDKNNRKRLERALELKLNQDEKINHNNKNVDVYDSLVFFLVDNRDNLYKRINDRVDQMIKEGLLAEVKKLYPDNIAAQALSAIGYKELASYLDGKISFEEATELIKKHTRNYAKRQITWFKHQTKAVWINIENKTYSEVVKEITDKIKEFIEK